MVHITYKLGDKLLECVFNLGDESGYVISKHSDGEYLNLFNDEIIEIKEGKLPLSKDPIIIKK